jgi:hypothetical protein
VTRQRPSVRVNRHAGAASFVSPTTTTRRSFTEGCHGTNSSSSVKHVWVFAMANFGSQPIRLYMQRSGKLKLHMRHACFGLHLQESVTGRKNKAPLFLLDGEEKEREQRSTSWKCLLGKFGEPLSFFQHMESEFRIKQIYLDFFNFHARVVRIFF